MSDMKRPDPAAYEYSEDTAAYMDHLEAENKRLREALAFYENNWEWENDVGPTSREPDANWEPSDVLLDDGGLIAHAALDGIG